MSVTRDHSDVRTAGAGAKPGIQIELGDLDQLELYPIRSEINTVLEMLLDSAVRPHPSLPPTWRSEAISMIGRHGTAVVAPLRSSSWLPRMCVRPEEPGERIAERLTAFREVDLASDPFLAKLGDRPPEAWLQVLDRPLPWVSAMHGLMSDLATMVSGYWRTADLLLHHHEQRIAATSGAAAVASLLVDLWPGARLDGSRLLIPAGTSVDGKAGKRLGLMPMLSGQRSCQFGISIDDENGNPAPHRAAQAREVTWLGFPVPGLLSLDQATRRRPEVDPLTTLLGEMRADMLRRLQRPRSMRDLADLVHCSASTATYHCNKLADAGVISRYRTGSAVWVKRSERGDVLLDLLG